MKCTSPERVKTDLKPRDTGYQTVGKKHMEIRSLTMKENVIDVDEGSASYEADGDFQVKEKELSHS